MSGWTSARGRRAELGASGLTAAAYTAAVAARQEYPFGPTAVAGAESVPYHAHLRDLLHGSTTGDLLFNWGSGYGAPFLPDLAAYLANPFSWPAAALLPRGSIALAAFLVPLLSLGLAAALTTRLLGRLHPGPGWQRALLGAGYGLCAWVVQDGVTTPAWLWGTVSLPLLCLAGDWCLRGRHRLVGILAVTVALAGNLPTGVAAMAGAGLVLLLQLVLTDRPPRARLGALWRAGSAGLLGALLAAPVVTVGLKAARAAQPGPLTGYRGAPGLADYLGQLLPGGRPGLPLPDVSVGMLGLLLAATLPFNRGLARRERIGWPLLLVLAGAGLVWRPEVLLWHDPGLTTGTGTPYLAAFVLSGLLVMAAWVSLSRPPDLPALAGGAGVVAVVVTVAQVGGGGLTGATWVLVTAGGAVVAAGLWLLRRGGAERAVAAGLTVAVVAGASYAAYAGAPTGGAQVDAGQAREAYRVLRAERTWPDGRADPGPHAFTDNDPMLLDGQGGGYRSDRLPRVTAELLHDLGAGWYSGGRQTLSPADPVGRAVFGVRTFLADGGGGFVVGRAGAAAPLVTVRAGVPVVDGSSVWARQGSLLDARNLYEVPELTPVGGSAGPTPHGSSGWSVPAGGAGFEASCSPGSTAYFHGPWYAGTVSALGTEYVSAGQQPVVSEPVHPLGTVPGDGRIRLLLRAGAVTQVPERPLGCLAPGALERAVAGLTAAERVTAGGHTLTAELPVGAIGTAVVAAPAVEGWTCRVNGGPERVPGSYLGLIAVPLGDAATTVSCSYRPPGLTDGLAISAAALAVLAAVVLLSLARRRPQRNRPEGE
ncbi:YfhO family protein [Kitasatospora sp. NPDC051853]|uniref:YfhO family protein n=1 Tax=Kitasatospora sp. NPDC051853 TaxID=3364058 RepID=UPI0037B75D9A